MSFFNVVGDSKSTNPSRWQGKKWYVFGDSNSNNAGVKEYHQFIQDQINCEVTNFAYGGAGYVRKGSTGTYPKISEQILQADEDADLVTVMAGGNDYAANIPLGSFGDLDTSTFYGALDEVAKMLINKYPTKKIAVFTQVRREVESANAVGVTVEQQVDATLKVFGKYSIPCFDLYRNGNMYPWNPQYQSVFMTDSVHLNDEGQQDLAIKILSNLNTI